MWEWLVAERRREVEGVPLRALGADRSPARGGASRPGMHRQSRGPTAENGGCVRRRCRYALFPEDRIVYL